MLFEIILKLYDYYYVGHKVFIKNFNKNKTFRRVEDNTNVVLEKVKMTTKQSKTFTQG